MNMTDFKCACGNTTYHAKGLCRKCYSQRPEVKAYQKAYKKAYSQRPEVKAQQKAYNQRPERKARVAELYRFSRPVKVPKGLREIQREYQQLLCRYGEKNGDIPRRDILRLEALSDYLGRDLEEWRLGKDKEAHAKRLEG